MHCRRVQRFIFLFADGQVTRTRTVQVAFRSHVEMCPHCARELEAAERLLALLRRGCRRHSAPEHLRSRLLGLLADRWATQSEPFEED